jgi:DNA-binding transcriptional ArsR family regulator
MSKPTATTPRKRRGRGEGAVYPTKAGMWRGAVLVTDPVTGQSKRRYVSGRTADDVRSKVRRLREDAERGVTAAGPRLTTSAYLTSGQGGRTYCEVAEVLGLGLGSVYVHLRRLRLCEPAVYILVMAERRRQLANRHEEALSRAAAHSNAWHRAQSARRYFYRFGHWPWERRAGQPMRSDRR